MDVLKKLLLGTIDEMIIRARQGQAPEKADFMHPLRGL